MVVLMGILIDAHAFRYEPARAMCLLPANEEQLKCNEKDYEHGRGRVSFLIKEVLTVELQIQRQEELHRSHHASKLHAWSFATTMDVTVEYLGNPDR